MQDRCKEFGKVKQRTVKIGDAHWDVGLAAAACVIKWNWANPRTKMGLRETVSG